MKKIYFIILFLSITIFFGCPLKDPGQDNAKQDAKLDAWHKNNFVLFVPKDSPWELIEGTYGTSSSTGDFIRMTERLKVPGGWIYRSYSGYCHETFVLFIPSEYSNTIYEKAEKDK